MPRRPAKSTRRARGTGAMFYSSKLKLWIGRVKIGRKPDGLPLYAERRAATQRELQEKLAAVVPPGPQTTVAEWAERWYAALSVRPSTRSTYRNSLDRFVLPTFGSRRVGDISSHDIERACQVWSEALSPNSLRKVAAHLRNCLEAARRAKLIADNPVKDARKPRAKKVPIDPFTPDELALVIATPGAGMFALIAAIGCRVGEAAALDVSDYDATAGTISISKTFDGRHGLRPPKSENSIRTVRVPKQAIPAIDAAARNRKRGPLFCRKDGERIKNHIARNWKEFARKIGLRYRNPHQLRHSVATALVSAGVPIGDVAAMLGDTVATVVSTYLHPSGSDPATAMERLLSL